MRSTRTHLHDPEQQAVAQHGRRPLRRLVPLCLCGQRARQPPVLLKGRQPRLQIGLQQLQHVHEQQRLALRRASTLLAAADAAPAAAAAAAAAAAGAQARHCVAHQLLQQLKRSRGLLQQWRPAASAWCEAHVPAQAALPVRGAQKPAWLVTCRPLGQQQL
jgi:hypothetical protein